MESGLLYASTMQPLPRVTSVKVDWSASRANVLVLNRGKPLEQRPIVNYIPVNVSIDLYSSDNSLEQMLALVNTTGIATNITDTNAATAAYGIRSMQLLYAPTNSANYNGELDIKSGVLTSYSIQGSVSSPVRESIQMQFLDMSGNVNSTLRDSNTYLAQPVIPAGISLTGIQFSGYGITGANVQSFSLGINFTRTQVFQLGTRFPVTRPLTDVSASLQVQGYFEGVNNTVTGLSQYYCGFPTYGTVALVLSPSCGTSSPRTITITNPYIESYSVDGQVGNFSTFSMAFSMPLGPNPLDTGDGSVLTFT